MIHVEGKVVKRITDLFVCLVLRMRLNRVCKALGITPYPWQTEFVLAKNPRLVPAMGRRSGQTTAVILRALVYGSSSAGDFSQYVLLDPDSMRSRRTQLFAYGEYWKAYAACAKARAIPRQPPLPPPIADPWYGPQYYSRARAERFRREAQKIMCEEKGTREVQQHAEGIEI